MARIVKEYDVRRREILNAAMSLFYSRGYDQTTINQIIESVGVAKGTFYHYFRSKSDLLDQVVKDMTQEIIDGIQDVLDSNWNALRKFEELFHRARTIKLSNVKALMVSAKEIYREENLLIRHRMTREVTERFVPIYASIIRQGIEEGVFRRGNPEIMAEMVLVLGHGMADKMSKELVAIAEGVGDIDAFKEALWEYERAFERILGAEENSIKMFPKDDLEEVIAVLTGVRDSDAA